MTEITKTIDPKYGFAILKCEKGHRITSWNEGDDIKEYTSFTIAYCPADVDVNIYHCVTDEQDAELMAKQLEVIKAEEEEMNKNIGE